MSPTMARLPIQRRTRAGLTLLLTGVSLGGCMSFSPDAGMDPAQSIARTALNKDVAKVTSPLQAATAQERVEQLLPRSLTPDSAVQIALLKNRGLQAAFNDLGVSEATFVQASLPPVPTITLGRLSGPGSLDIERQILISLFQLATLPARQAIAANRFQAAQYKAAEAVLRLAADARRQYYRTVAANQTVAFLAQALATAESASTLATQLGETGALNKLEQAREHAFYTELGAQLAKARIQARVEREKLTRQLGLWGRDIDFKLPSSLPALPGRLEPGGALETRALGRRVDLQMARLDLQALAGQYGLNQATRFVSAFDLALANNAEVTRTVEVDADGTAKVSRESSKYRGPIIEFAIPIYDFGESAIRGARETYFASANRLAERAVNARSEVREAYLRYRGQYDLTRHYQGSVLPLRKTIQDQALLQYSGMLVDVTQLIIDARARILSNIQAIEARRDFWVAATDLQAAIIGGGLGSAGEAAGAEGGATSVAAATPD